MNRKPGRNSFLVHLLNSRCNMHWWTVGFFGAAVVSLLAVMRLAWAILNGNIGNAGPRHVPAFLAGAFGIGFLCGVVVWGLKGVCRRLGMAGDALVGGAVTAILCVSCVFLSPEMLSVDIDFI